MKIKNGMLTSIDSSTVAALNSYFNGIYPDVDAEFTININQKDKSDDQSLDEKILRIACEYKHPLAPTEKIWFAKNFDPNNTTLELAIETTIQHHQEQLRCNHQFERPKDAFGKVFPDGRCDCNRCHLQLPNYLPVIKGSQVVRSTFSPSFVSQYDWGDDCYLQCGDKGLVISSQQKKSYCTAFVEAFPKIHGLGTFIRGEGANVLEAETKCWEKYQRYLACPQHEWTRTVHGTERTDGYAKCLNCGLSAKALKPSTTCHICQRPTTKKNNGEHICYTHYYEIEEEARVTSRILELEQCKDIFLSKESSARVRFNYLFKHRLLVHILKALGEDAFEKKKSRIDHIVLILMHNFYVIEMGMPPHRHMEQFSDEDYEKMQTVQDRMIASIATILDAINKEGGAQLHSEDFYPNFAAYKAKKEAE